MKRIYKSKINQRIIKSAKKIGVAVLIAAFFASIMPMRGTNAGFLDEEISEGNSITAGTLDALAAQTSFAYTAGTAPMEPGDVITQAVNFKNDGLLPFQYEVEYLSASGGDLCEAMLLTAKKDSIVIYDQLPLSNFDAGDIIDPVPPVAADSLILNPAESDDWEFILELPADAAQTLENQTCDFNFKLTAWQTDFTGASLGFWDEELAEPGAGVEIEAGEWESPGDVVINEVMWMGSTEDSGDEWIELRNMTGHAIDIGQWEIENVRSAHADYMIPASKSISANGYFLIANHNKNSSNSALNVDPDITNGSLVLYNSNNGNIILKDKNRNIIDEAKGDNWPAGYTDGNASGLHQSMERNDAPGDGTLSGSWHTCVSGGCNDGTYWDAAEGNNYGTPGAPNLSPVVMNEFVFNPSGGNKEWVELYNMLDEDFDVSGWYFKNEDGGKIIISKDNAKGGKTKIPGKGYLVIYPGENFLDDESGALSFYNDMDTPDDKSDDAREDVYEYEGAGAFPEGKSFARFPDGTGIWIDPEATPGGENKLSKKELGGFRLLVYEKCFDGKRVRKNRKESFCAPVFLEYLGMIKNLDDKKIRGKALADILEMKKEKEKKKLAKMLKETEKMLGSQVVSSGGAPENNPPPESPAESGKEEGDEKGDEEEGNETVNEGKETGNEEEEENLNSNDSEIESPNEFYGE